MSLVLPIVFYAVCLGLFVPRLTRRHWTGLVAWIALVVAYNYIKS